jgi:hypothetical protein
VPGERGGFKREVQIVNCTKYDIAKAIAPAESPAQYHKIAGPSEGTGTSTPLEIKFPAKVKTEIAAPPLIQHTILSPSTGMDIIALNVSCKRQSSMIFLPILLIDTRSIISVSDQHFWRCRSNNPRRENFFDESTPREKPYSQISQVKLPPKMAMLRGSRIGVVIVVPTFPPSQNSDEQIVPAAIIGRIIAISPYMSNRIHRPADVPHNDDPHENPPDEDGSSASQCLSDGAAGQQFSSTAAEKEYEP